MSPFEFIVDGPPLSHQTRSRAQLQRWIATVRREALAHWPTEQPLATSQLKITVVYYHDAAVVHLGAARQ